MEHGDETVPVSFDMQKFKEKMIGTDKNPLGPEYPALRKNLAHISLLDAQFRTWLQDGTVTASSGAKWMSLLGGTDHNLAERALIAYVDDAQIPEILRKSAIHNLITPRKRMYSTTNKVCQLASKEHVHRNLCHMVCGGLLARYAPLEETKFLSNSIQQIYNDLHQKVVSVGKNAGSAANTRELTVAVGALGNIH